MLVGEIRLLGTILRTLPFARSVLLFTPGDAADRNDPAASCRHTHSGTAHAAATAAPLRLTKTSSIAGRIGGIRLKPSAAPSRNQSSIRSAIMLRRARRDEMPARAGHVAEQLPQRRLLPPHQADDHLGAAARRLHCGRIGEVLRPQRLVQLQVRKIVAAEPAGQPLAADFRIAQVVQFAGDALRLGLGAADHRAQARQDQHLVRRAALVGASAFRSA